MGTGERSYMVARYRHKGVHMEIKVYIYTYVYISTFCLNHCQGEGMDELKSHWKVDNAAWDAALSLIDTKGDLIEEFDVALKKFTKRNHWVGR